MPPRTRTTRTNSSTGWSTWPKKSRRRWHRSEAGRSSCFTTDTRYFEDRFGLTAAGSAVVSSERTPGVRRIRELRQKVREFGVVCLVDEPHFDRRLIDTVIEGTDVRSGTVDPMGATAEVGPDLYFTLLRNMSAAFRDCLAPSD